MSIKTTPWDSAQFLKTDGDVTAYLQACMEEAPDDAGFIAHALGVAARARSNMSGLARETGLSREGLYKALAEDGNPSFGTVLKVVGALGYRLTLVEKAAVKRKPRGATLPAAAAKVRRPPARR